MGDNSKKIIVQIDLHDDKGKQKAMKAVSSIPGIESISMDMKDKKLTVTGDVDPVCVIYRLRKCGHAVIVSVGPAKDPKKEAEDKKKKEEEEKKKKAAEEEKKRKEEEEKRIAELVAANKCYNAYNPCGSYNPYGSYNRYPPQYYCVPSSCEENPSSCVIM